jgi:hypothetical protein
VIDAGLCGEQWNEIQDERIPTAELRQIRRHRDPKDPSRVHPWLRDYQIAVDQGRGVDAVAILQEQDALVLHDTRAQAMGGIVDEWDQWRHAYQPAESALIVHGPNSDVDLVNELAQQKRDQAGELGEQAVRAVDRDYLRRPGDVVAIRNAAYTLDQQPGRPRPKRIENGQTAIIDAVDADRDTLTLLLREPGAEPRLVEIDQARLRAEARRRRAGRRGPSALRDAQLPGPGATVQGTATLAGHWSQAKRETYVGDTRAVYRHSVHVAREDLGVDGTDEDRVLRYAQRIAENRQRHASIRSLLDPTLQLAVTLPDQQPLPGPADGSLLQPSAPTRGDTSSTPRPSTPDTSPATPAPAAAGDASGEVSAEARRRLDEQLKRALVDPPAHLLQALGPVPRRAHRAGSGGSAKHAGSRRCGSRPAPSSSPPAARRASSPRKIASRASAHSAKLASATRCRTSHPSGKVPPPPHPLRRPPARRVRSRRRRHRRGEAAPPSVVDLLGFLISGRWNLEARGSPGTPRTQACDTLLYVLDAAIRVSLC